MNFGISDMNKRNEVYLLLSVLSYYSCSMVGTQSKFKSKSFWSEQLLSAMVNSRFCVSDGWQMFISQVAFHLSMENNGLALCPALSWANKASYLTWNQPIIHLALNTWVSSRSSLFQFALNLANFCKQTLFCLQIMLFVYMKYFNAPRTFVSL